MAVVFFIATAMVLAVQFYFYHRGSTVALPADDLADYTWVLTESFFPQKPIYIFLYANFFIQFSTFIPLSDLWLKQLTYFFPIEEKNVIYSHSKSHFFVKTRLSRCSYSIVDLLCWSKHEIGRLFLCFFFLSTYRICALLSWKNRKWSL